MSDMNISVDEANAWVNKVESEIAEVNKVLEKAVACVKDYQESDDTIYQELSKAVKSYESAWKHLETGYKEVFEGLRAAFKAQVEAVKQAIEAVKREAQKAKS